MFFIVSYPLPGAGTSPIGFVSKVRIILMYLCVRSSDKVSKLALGQFVLDVQGQRISHGHQIFANLEFQSKRQRRATLFGAGYTKYQPEMTFLDLFRAKTYFCGAPPIKLQNTKVL